jgi:hypothetical protein
MKEFFENLDLGKNAIKSLKKIEIIPMPNFDIQHAAFLKKTSNIELA